MPVDTTLGPKTGYYRSIAREGWLPVPRQPEVRLAVGVGVIGLFIVAVSGVLIYESGEAFAEILFGLGCIGWSVGQLRVRWGAFVAWRRIGRVALVADTIELRLGEPWACRIDLVPRRELTVAACTLTVWATDSRQARGGGALPTAWAFDCPLPVGPLPRGVRQMVDGVIEIPLPPEAAPSRFGADWTRQWKVTAELTTTDGAHWRRDYPVIVSPAFAGSSGGGSGSPDDDTGAPADADAPV